MDNENPAKLLSNLAQEAQLVEGLDWSKVDQSQATLFDEMARQVLEQLESVKEDERAVVAMATMTKLLVENLVLKAMLRNKG